MPPAPSSAAPSDQRLDGPAGSREARLVAAGEYLAARGVYGLVWCDESLVVRALDGELAAFASPGQRLTETVPALLGFDEQIKALRRKPDHIVDVPNVSFVGPDGATPRLNLTIFWLPLNQRFLMLVARVLSRSALEGELSNQVRARMIAEETLVEQSKQIQRTNAELMRANRDLSEFAYIMSHDLKAPMRALRYASEDLERALPDATGGIGEHLARIRIQALRMSQMLTDLLAYSRVGRIEEAVEPVDTGALVASIVETTPRPAALSVEIAGTFPTIETVAAPLDLALRNLVENAIRHHDRGAGLVRVAGRLTPDTLAIEVADDGPGIDPAHHETIFLPFRRLAKSDDGGSGIGLAIVRRAIESVGGRISVHSAPATSRGTTFRIAWPLRIRPAADAAPPPRGR